MSKPKNKVFDFVAHEEKINSLIKQSFKYSYMSNAKWKKCFILLEPFVSEFQVVWKFVGAENNGVKNWLPPRESLEENYINNQFWFGPRYFKEIEWLEFPWVVKPQGKEKIPATFYNQNINLVRELLESAGKWPIEETAEGFRIYGHKA